MTVLERISKEDAREVVEKINGRSAINKKARRNRRKAALMRLEESRSTPAKEASMATEEVKAETLAVDTMAGDLTSALLDRVKNLQKPYQQMSEAEQRNVIYGLRAAVSEMIRNVVRTIAADGRKVIVAEIEKVEVKDGMKAVLSMSKRDENRMDLIDACGSSVLIVVADASQYMGGEDPKPEPDQTTLITDDDDKPVADSCESLAAE
jgi:hypothetical protein